MKNRLTFLAMIPAAVMLLSFNQVIADETVYGWQLMTEQERMEHREKMQSMKTMEERERYRKEHHEKMMQRAKERGVTLPDVPSDRGKGMKQGNGQGKGMGDGMGR